MVQSSIAFAPVCDSCLLIYYMFVYKDIEEKKGASKVSAQPEACPLLPTTARPARAKSSLSRLLSALL
jgi:hypothetical protein